MMSTSPGAGPSSSVAGLTVGLLVLIWGTTWAAIRIGLEGMPPFTGISLRFAIAGGLLLAVALWRGVRFRPGSREISIWLVNGLFSFCCSYGLVYWAEQWVPSGLTSVLWSSFPLHVAILAHFLLPEERLAPQGMGGILLGFLGILVLFSEDLDGMAGEGVAWAAGWLLLSPLAAAIGNVAVKRWGAGIHHLSVTAVPMLITAAVMGALAALTERGRGIEWSPVSVGALLYLAIFGSAVTFSLYFWLLRHLSATRLSLIAYCTPVVAVTVGAAFLGEPLTAKVVTGSLLVIGGVALVARPGGLRRSAAAD